MKSILLGFIGALIAIILSSIYNRLNVAIKVNRVRMAIINYLELLAKPKLDRFIDDCNHTIKYLTDMDFANPEKKQPYDEMPMLTSEVIKSFEQHDLLLACYNSLNYTDLLAWYYSIEFLKKNMPRDIYNGFSQWTNKHLENEKIPPGEKQFEHIKNCRSIAREKKDSITNIEMKISTAKQSTETLTRIVKNLKGQHTYWIWKYFWSI
jgi:hypothetical protein